MDCKDFNNEKYLYDIIQSNCSESVTKSINKKLFNHLSKPFSNIKNPLTTFTMTFY